MEYLQFFIAVFMSFFTLINPLCSMPVFLSMSSELTHKQRNKVARKAVTVAFLTLLTFAFGGDYIFEIFGISENSLKVVGGLIFLMIGYDMLEARNSKTKGDEEEESIDSSINDISITPLGIPIICGPGAMVNAIVQMQNATDELMVVMLVLGIAAIILTTYLIYLFGTRISKFIGETGLKVMMRIMGLILMSIAIEFLFSGLKPILVDIIQAA